jgi:hypothetical protein
VAVAEDIVFIAARATRAGKAADKENSDSNRHGQGHSIPVHHKPVKQAGHRREQHTSTPSIT